MQNHPPHIWVQKHGPFPTGCGHSTCSPNSARKSPVQPGCVVSTIRTAWNNAPQKHGKKKFEENHQKILPTCQKKSNPLDTTNAFWAAFPRDRSSIVLNQQSARHSATVGRCASAEVILLELKNCNIWFPGWNSVRSVSYGLINWLIYWIKWE